MDGGVRKGIWPNFLHCHRETSTVMLKSAFSAVLWSGWVDWVDYRRLSLSVNSSARSSLILMKLGVSDMWARGYKATEWILNICINCAN